MPISAVTLIDAGRAKAIAEDFSAEDLARSLGLDLTPLSLQQLVVRASGQSAGAGSLTERTWA